MTEIKKYKKMGQKQLFFSVIMSFWHSLIKQLSHSSVFYVTFTEDFYVLHAKYDDEEDVSARICKNPPKEWKKINQESSSPISIS